MDVLPRITRQLIELFRAMSFAQRATFVAVPLLVFAALCAVLVYNKPDDQQAVSFGKTFSPEELVAAETALQRAGLTEHRRQGGRLLAPARLLDRYNAALVEFDAVPNDLGTQLLKQYESLGPFATDRQRQEMKDAVILQELRRMLEAVPEIQTARVAIAHPGRRTGWNQKTRVTANVAVTPRPGRVLSSRLVASLRQVVASMVSDLQPLDVTIFDVERGHAYAADSSDDPFDSRLIQRVREFTRQYEQQIEKALNYIPSVGVAVHIDLDSLKSAVAERRKRRDPIRTAYGERDETSLSGTHTVKRPRLLLDEILASNTASEHSLPLFRDGVPNTAASAMADFDRESSFLRDVATNRNPDAQDAVIEPAAHHRVNADNDQVHIDAALPQSVQVSVSIPRDFYGKVAAQRKRHGEQNEQRLNLDAIEEEFLAKVERTVSRLIPAGSPTNAISVTTVDRLPTPSIEPKLGWAEHAQIMAHQYGGSATLTLFVMVALVLLMRISKPVAEQKLTTSPANNVLNMNERSASRNVATASDSQSPELFGSPSPTRTELREVRLPVGLETSSPASIRNRETLPEDDIRESRHRSATTVSPVAESPTPAAPATPLESQTSPFKRGPDHASSVTMIDDKLNSSSPARDDSTTIAGPFGFLCHRDAEEIQRLLVNERPQTIAVVMAQLPPSLSALVLSGFSPDRQADVLHRVAMLGPTDDLVLKEIAEILTGRLGKPGLQTGGLDLAASVLREAPRGTTNRVLAALDRQNESTSERLRQTLFSFDDLIHLDDDSIRIVLQETDDRQWALALKASSQDVRRRVLRCLSPRVAEALETEMNSLGPVRLSEVTAVRQQIAETVRQLEEAGDIRLLNKSASD